MLRCCTFSYASTHTSCYAAARSLALPHIRHAMLLHVLLRFHTYVMPRARTTCHAGGCKAWKRASKQQVPEKRLKWQNVARNRGEFVKHLGRKPTKKSCSLAGTQALDRQWDWFKNPIPRQLRTHKDCRQDFKKIGSTCMLQSGARSSKAMSWTTSDNFVLERKKWTFWRNPRRTKLLFLACKTLGFPLLKWPFQRICTKNLLQS